MTSNSNMKTNAITIDSDEENEIQIVNRTPKFKAINKRKSTVFESVGDQENSGSLSKSAQNQQTSDSTTKKHSDVIALCPLSTAELPCDRCKIEKTNGDKIFTCHCGARSKTLKQGRTNKAVSHWKTGEMFLEHHLSPTS